MRTDVSLTRTYLYEHIRTEVFRCYTIYPQGMGRLYVNNTKGISYRIAYSPMVNKWIAQWLERLIDSRLRDSWFICPRPAENLRAIGSSHTS